MKKTAIAAVFSALVLTMVSCTKKLDDRLPGTWNVTEVKSEPASGNGSASTTTNAGTIIFNADGSGSNSLVLWGTSVNGDFTWVAADNNATVTISGFNVIAGQYTVLTNKPKEQVWQQLNSAGDKYTYTLEK